MSSSDEIMEVFNEDISRMTKQVFNRYGKAPFYDGFKDLSIYELVPGSNALFDKCVKVKPVAGAGKRDDADD